ncbi:MAG: M20 family metallopeptidase [Lachnospiraceae bacterium]|nr:M20 family metallopeptidase [Lachnospiraceae bacterium]
MAYLKPTDDESRRILAALLKVDTCQPEGREGDILPLIRSFLPKTCVFRVIDHGGGRQSLTAEIPGRRQTGALVFLGHVDTVSCGNPKDWQYEPHSAYSADGLMYGRGAADMKGGIAAMIMTAARLADSGAQPEVPIRFCFTADEEKGGLGVLAMKQEGLFDDAAAMIVCEPSDNMISFCEKGALWLHLDIWGVASHASRPYLGRNAVEYGMWFVKKLREKAEDGRVHPILGSTTMAVTRFQGGTMTNVVPAEAFLEIDIRTIPGTSHQVLTETAEQLCRDMQAGYSNVGARLTVINDRAAIECPYDGDFRNRAAASARACGLSLEKRGHYFFTDASLVIPDLPVPFVIAGPGDDKKAHIINECIAVSSVTRFAEFYLDFAKKNAFGRP